MREREREIGSYQQVEKSSLVTNGSTQVSLRDFFPGKVQVHGMLTKLGVVSTATGNCQHFTLICLHGAQRL